MQGGRFGASGHNVATERARGVTAACWLTEIGGNNNGERMPEASQDSILVGRGNKV